MYYKIFFTLLIALSFSFSNLKAADPVLKTQMDTISYAIGMNLGKNLKTDSLYLNLELMKLAISDVLFDKKTLMTEDEIMSAMMNLQAEITKKKEKKFNEESKLNKEKSETFLAENKKQKDIVTTASGLQYKVLKQGNGAKPAENSRVKVHYTGMLINNQVFDSSVERGEPATFPINGVIKGWTEALQLMNVGSKWMLYIPSDLAYGERGRQPKIGPNQALIFEVELLEILPIEETTPGNDGIKITPVK